MSAIGGLIDRTAGPASVKSPGRSTTLIARSVASIRATRVDHNIHNAGVLIDEKDFAPGISAVGRLIQSAFRVRSPEMPERCHINGFRVRRIDHNSTDALRLFKPNVRPTLAAVHGLIDTVSPGGTLAIVRFTGADPHDGGIGRRNRNRSDR